MTRSHLPAARESAQRTYDRRRARTAAEQLAVIPPNRWDDRTRQIIATLATISAPSRIDDLLEVFEPPIGGSAENTHDMPSPYSCAGELAGICSGGPAHHPDCPDVDARVAGCDRPSCGSPACVDCTAAGIPAPVALCGSLHEHDSIEQAKACDDLPRADTRAR